MKGMQSLSILIIFISSTVFGFTQQDPKSSSPNIAIESTPSQPKKLIRSKKLRQRRVRHGTMVIPPVTILHNPEYLSGEVSVAVAANSNPLIRIGMAQNGVTLIEFPSVDNFFAVHAGNSDLVTIEKSPSLKRDHHLVLRAGSGFLVTPVKSNAVVPATSIIAQMNSGMAITLMIYPVPLLKQQAHRLVINYDRDQVISERRRVGLATNLVEGETLVQSDNPLLSWPPVIESPAANADDSSATPKQHKTTKDDFKESVEQRLRDALANPKPIKRWSEPRHGLSISTISCTDINDSARFVVFAVRNVGVETLRLISGYPDLYVETANDNRKPIETESRIEKLSLASDSTDRAIPPGTVRYFAIAYEAPILGVKQHLKIVVAHMSAADEPVTADVTATAK